MWTSIKATGDTIEINMEDSDKPQIFDSKDEEIEWSRKAAKNILKFKKIVESGLFIPVEITRKLVEKADRTPLEDEILANEKTIANRKEKVITEVKVFFDMFSTLYGKKVDYLKSTFLPYVKSTILHSKWTHLKSCCFFLISLR